LSGFEPPEHKVKLGLLAVPGDLSGKEAKDDKFGVTGNSKEWIAQGKKTGGRRKGATNKIKIYLSARLEFYLKFAKGETNNGGES